MQVYKYKVEENLQKKVDRGCLLRHLLGPPEVDEEGGGVLGGEESVRDVGQVGQGGHQV